MTRRAIDLLGSSRNDAYEAALVVLRGDTREWWADTLARDPGELDEDEASAIADTEGLRRFLEGEVLPWFEIHKTETIVPSGTCIVNTCMYGDYVRRFLILRA
jgi:hypothetical protein